MSKEAERGRPPHPALGPKLPGYMGLCLLSSALIWSAHGGAEGTGWLVFIALCSGIGVACFLILFTVYWVAWLLRAHTEWLDG